MKRNLLKLVVFLMVITIPFSGCNDTSTNPSEPGPRKGAVCKDGTTSSATGSGACSGHGGVDHWIY